MLKGRFTKKILGRQTLHSIKDSVWYYIKGVYSRFDEHHSFLLGGGLAFSIFTCILPLILIVFSLLGFLVETPSIKIQITEFINNLVPYSKSSEFFEKIIFRRVDEFKIFKTLYGSLGIIGLFFAASGLFGSLRTILNSVFHIKEGPNILMGKLRDMGLVLLVVAFFLLWITILPVLDIMVNLLGDITFFQNLHLDFVYQFIISVAVSIFSLGVLFGVFFFIYYFIPDRRFSKKAALISALTATLLWELAKELFSYYIANAVTLTRVYGTYLLVIAVFFWIYYSALVFIVGAIVGQLYREKHKMIVKEAAE